jgi:hypothetical protein
LGKLYHEEALQQARVRNLTHQAKEHCKLRSEEHGRFLWLGKLTAAVRSS